MPRYPSLSITAPIELRVFFRTWEYHGCIIIFAIWETLLLRCIQWRRESPRRAYVVEVWERSVSLDVRKTKGPRSSPRGWMWARDKPRGSLLGDECELGASPEVLSLELNRSQLVSRVCFPLETLLVPRDTYRDLGEWSESDLYSLLHFVGVNSQKEYIYNSNCNLDLGWSRK